MPAAVGRVALVVRGSRDLRLRALETVASRCPGFRVLCDSPLVVVVERSGGEGLVKELGGMGAEVVLERPGRARWLCEGQEDGGRGFFTASARRALILAAPAVPAVVSIVGRIANDVPMMIAGSVAGGALYLAQLLGRRR